MKRTMFLLVGTVFALLDGCKKEEIDIPDINYNPSITYNSMTDQEGNVYKTVTIGTQIWMAENLRTTKYRNGLPIPEVSDAARWEGLFYGAYCKYNNNLAYVKVYGCLYNWLAVYDGKNIAPEGWHVPTSKEYKTLIAYLGGWEGVAKVLMEAGEAHWNCPGNVNTGVTNASGFTALPGGERYYYYQYILDKMSPSIYEGISCYSSWWTKTTTSVNEPNSSCTKCANCFVLNSMTSDGYLEDGNMAWGHSVRCIKD